MTGRPHSPRPSRRRALALLAIGLAGCGYSVRPPFSKSVRSVYVPVFKSTSFQKDLNLRLTQRVQEEIRRRTPFRVVGTPEEADSTLDGVVVFVDRNAMVESPFNLPRQVLGSVVVSVTWTDHRLSREKKRELVPVTVNENASFYPEIGETAMLGFDKAIDQLARQVVDLMEEPW